MTKKDLKKLKPLLSPCEYRVLECLQSGRWMSYKDINEATGQTRAAARLWSIDYKPAFLQCCISPELEHLYNQIFYREERWIVVENRHGERCRVKQYRIKR